MLIDEYPEYDLLTAFHGPDGEMACYLTYLNRDFAEKAAAVAVSKAAENGKPVCWTGATYGKLRYVEKAYGRHSAYLVLIPYVNPFEIDD